MMPLIHAETIVDDITVVALALLTAQDRAGAATSRQLFAALGTTAALPSPDAPAHVADPATAAALVGAVAVADGVSVSAEQIGAGLRAAGIYRRGTPPVRGQ